MNAVLNAGFMRDLERLYRSPSIELQFLNRNWPRVHKLVRKEQQRLLNLIPKDDPLRQGLNLLDPFRLSTNENLHTLALAYLFDPQRPHGFGKTPLRYFLQNIGKSKTAAGVKAQSLLGFLRKPDSRVLAIPERRHVTATNSRRKSPRTDLWVEVHSGSSKRLLLIENKIGSKESDQQLTDYEVIADDWCRKNSAIKPLLIFLTPEGQEPDSSQSGRWVPVAYSQIASCLRKVWQVHKHAQGGQWLRLYVATLANGVLGLTITRVDQLDIQELRDYLGESGQ